MAFLGKKKGRPWKDHDPPVGSDGSHSFVYFFDVITGRTVYFDRSDRVVFMFEPSVDDDILVFGSNAAGVVTGFTKIPLQPEPQISAFPPFLGKPVVSGAPKPKPKAGADWKGLGEETPINPWGVEGPTGLPPGTWNGLGGSDIEDPWARGAFSERGLLEDGPRRGTPLGPGLGAEGPGVSGLLGVTGGRASTGSRVLAITTGVGAGSPNSSTSRISDLGRPDSGGEDGGATPTTGGSPSTGGGLSVSFDLSSSWGRQASVEWALSGGPATVAKDDGGLDDLAAQMPSKTTDPTRNPTGLTGVRFLDDLAMRAARLQGSMISGSLGPVRAFGNGDAGGPGVTDLSGILNLDPLAPAGGEIYGGSDPRHPRGYYSGTIENQAIKALRPDSTNDGSSGGSEGVIIQRFIGDRPRAPGEGGDPTAHFGGGGSVVAVSAGVAGATKAPAR